MSHSPVDREARAARLGQRPFVLWLTGLSGAGKSTLAVALESEFYRRGLHSYVLDGDVVRHGLNQDLGFSAQDRRENLRRIGEVARLFVDAGVIVISAFIAPYQAERERLRRRFTEGEYIEVYVEAPLAVCEARDPKGLYKKARAGEIRDFTGIDAPYEPPLRPELTVHTGAAGVDECMTLIVQALTRRGLLPAA